MTRFCHCEILRLCYKLQNRGNLRFFAKNLSLTFLTPNQYKKTNIAKSISQKLTKPHFNAS
ncbi:hypothetical protein [Helicobacter sp. T3_23-1059]